MNFTSGSLFSVLLAYLYAIVPWMLLAIDFQPNTTYDTNSQNFTEICFMSCLA